MFVGVLLVLFVCVVCLVFVFWLFGFLLLVGVCLLSLIWMLVITQWFVTWLVFCCLLWLLLSLMLVCGGFGVFGWLSAC